MRTATIVIVALFTAPGSLDARQLSAASDSAAAVEAHREWWRAFTVGDTASLARLTASDLVLTLSAGASFDRAGALAQASVRGDPARVRLILSRGEARFVGDGAVVTTGALEAIGPSESRFRYLSVLRRGAGGWQVVAAQSTREPIASRAVLLAAEDAAEYAGRYRTPAGAVITIARRDSSLALIPPAGGDGERLRPVTSSVFELMSGQSADGVVRLVFERDAKGRVSALTRLTVSGVARFPRVP